MCPNVQVTLTRDWWLLHTNVDGDDKRRHNYDLIQAAGEGKSLQHFERIARCDVDMLNSVLSAMPSIPSVVTTGRLEYGVGIRSFLTTLSEFENLTTLTTPGSFAIGVGFNPPWCGNAYDGEDGKAYRQQVSEKRLRANRRVADMVFWTSTGLTTLWIGDSLCVTATRNNRGGLLEIAFDEGERDAPTDWPN